MRLEAQAIARALGGKAGCGTAPARFTAFNVAIELYTVGLGAKHMPGGLDRENTRHIVMAGLGGALDGSLHLGDLVAEGELPSTSASMPWRLGEIHTAEQIISRPAQKAELFRRTGALVVDMENAFARRAAAGMGIPFIGIRAILDTADQVLDPVLGNLVDDLGRLKLGAMMRTVLWHPGLIFKARRLGADAAMATGRLGEGVRCLVEQLGQ